MIAFLLLSRYFSRLAVFCCFFFVCVLAFFQPSMENLKHGSISTAVSFSWLAVFVCFFLGVCVCFRVLIDNFQRGNVYCCCFCSPGSLL